MKKILEVVVCLLLMIGVVACSSKSNTLDLKKTNELQDMNLTFISADTVSQVQPGIPSQYSFIYKAETNHILDLVFKVENKTTQTIKINDTFSTKVKINEEDEKNGYFIYEPSTRTSVTKTGSLDAQSTGYLHLCTTIDKNVEVKDINVVLIIDETEYELSGTLSDFQANKVYKKIGEKVTIDNKAEMTLEKLSTVDKVLPSKPTGMYQYFTANDTSKDTLLVLKTTVKNISSSALSLKDLMGYGVKIDGESTYGNSVYEKVDGSTLTSTTLGTVEANQSLTVYFMVEIAKESKDKSMEVQLVTEDGLYFIQNNIK